MSKINFEVPNMNEKYKQGIRLDTNVLRGFKTSLRNGQQRQALDYFNEVLDILIRRVEECGPAEAPTPPVPPTTPEEKPAIPEEKPAKKPPVSPA